MENVSSYKNALRQLKRNQIVDMFKKIKDVLNLNVGKKSKPQLIEEIISIHGSGSSPNLFNGKQLLSFNKDSHINIPNRDAPKDRKTEKLEKQKKARVGKLSLVKSKISKTESNIEKLTKAQKERQLKLLNLEKTKKTDESKQRERKRQYASFKEGMIDIRKRLKGASKQNIEKLKKELEELKKQYKR